MVEYVVVFVLEHLNCVQFSVLYTKHIHHTYTHTHTDGGGGKSASTVRVVDPRETHRRRRSLCSHNLPPHLRPGHGGTSTRTGWVRSRVTGVCVVPRVPRRRGLYG